MEETPCRRSFEDEVIDIARPSTTSRGAREQAGEDVFGSSPNTASQAGATRKVGKGMTKTTTSGSKSSVIAIHGSPDLDCATGDTFLGLTQSSSSSPNDFAPLSITEALLSIPWCILMGSLILLFPRLLHHLSQPVFPIPPPGPARFAYLASNASAFVLSFLALLSMAAHGFHASGLLVMCGVLGASMMH